MQTLLSVLLPSAGLLEFIEACEDLHASERYTNRVKAAIPIPLQDFVSICLSDAVWRKLDGADPRIHAPTGYSPCKVRFASQAKRCTGPSP